MCVGRYNAVLRGQTGNAYLEKQFRELCINNMYASTLHSINSAVVMLAKIQKAGQVYRGVSNAELPEAFWQPNSYGVRGGIEVAFMSTTQSHAIQRPRSARIRGMRVSSEPV